MSVLKVRNGSQWDIVPAIKGDTGDPAADESITDAMLVPDGIKTEIEWLWGNQLTDSREGNILQTEDAYKGPIVSLGVDGKSTQVVTTGKNLLDEANNIVRGYFYDSTAKIEGGGTSIYAPVTEGETYTMSVGNGNRYSVAFTAILPAVNVPFVAHASNQRTFTVPSDAKYVVFYIDSASDKTPSGYQLEIGSTATAYEPYTGGKASPNPDYPQDILSVDDLTLVLAGKNLLDVFNDPSNPRKNTSASGNGNQPFQYDSTNDAYYTGNFSRVPISIPADGTYTLTMTAKKSATTGNYFYHLTNAGYTYSNVLATTYAQHSRTFTATAGEILTLTIYNTAYVQNIQLELGSTATAYEPYIGTTVPDLLPEGTSLRSLPDGTKDELHLSYLQPSTREGWAWYDREVVQAVGHIADMSTLEWSYSTSRAKSNSLRSILVPPPDSITLPILIAEKYVPGRYNIRLDDHPEAIAVAPNDGQLVIYAANASDLPTGELDYKLATPVTTQLDPIELPIMPTDKATVWSDPSANLKLTYILDNNLVIEGLESTISDLVTS